MGERPTIEATASGDPGPRSLTRARGLGRLADIIGDGLVRFDRRCRLVAVNAAVVREARLSRERMLGRTPRELGFPDPAHPLEQRLSEVFETASPCVLDLSWEGQQGLRHVQVRLVPEARTGGSVEHVLGIARDISRLRSTEAALRRSETRTEQDGGRAKLLAEALPVLVWAVDAKGSATYFNRMWLDFTGRSLEQELGDGWLEHLHIKDVGRWSQAHATALANRHPLRVESRLRRWDGAHRWVQAVGRPLLSPDGVFEGLVGSCIDVTERREAEDDLKTSRETVRALSARLLSIQEEERKHVSREIHDGLGQSLTALRIDLAQMASASPSTCGQVEPMKALLDSMLRDVRNVARRLRPATLDHLGLIDAIEGEAQQFQDRTGIVCSVRAARDVRAGDDELGLGSKTATALFRIVQEALTNVARHALASRVVISLRHGSSRLSLEVRDDGRGISEQQANDPMALGLVGMRERVLPWGGAVTIRGTPMEGTRLQIEIPFGPRIPAPGEGS